AWHAPPRAPHDAATHTAEVPPAPQAVGTGRVVPEDVLPVQPAERLKVLGVALSPRDPQDRWPSIGSLARLGHSCSSPLSLLPCPKRWRETSIPPRGRAPAVSLFLPEVSPPARP